MYFSTSYQLKIGAYQTELAVLRLEYVHIADTRHMHCFYFNKKFIKNYLHRLMYYMFRASTTLKNKYVCLFSAKMYLSFNDSFLMNVYFNVRVK